MPLIKKYLADWLAVCVAGVLLSASFISLLILWQMHWDGPWRDMWEFMPWLQHAYQSNHIEQLWGHYGASHRFYVAKLLWLADWHLAAASNHFLLSVAVAGQLLIFSLISVLVSAQELNWRTKLLLLSLVFFYLFSPTQLFNFLYTFDVQWFVVTSVAVASFYILTRTIVTPARLLVVLCLFVVAMGNNFAAVMIAPISILLMYLNGCRKYAIYYASLVLLFLSLYLHDLPAGDANMISLVWQAEGLQFLDYLKAGFIIFIAYPLAYLASPLAYIVQLVEPSDGLTSFGQVLPQLGVALVSMLIIRAMLWGGKLTSAQLFALAIIGFCVGVAYLTSLGRAFFFDTAFAERFQNIVLLFWVGVSLFLTLRWQTLGLMSVLFIYLCYFAWHKDHSFNAALINVNRTALANAALVAGVDDRLNVLQLTVSKIHYADFVSLREPTVFMQENQLAMFAKPEWRAPTDEERHLAISCQPKYSVKLERVTVRGNALYWSLQDNGVQPAAWFLFEADRLRAVLQPIYSDDVFTWLRQLLAPMSSYAGYSVDTFNKDNAAMLYARTDSGWCYIKDNVWRRAIQ